MDRTYKRHPYRKLSGSMPLAGLGTIDMGAFLFGTRKYMQGNDTSTNTGNSSGGGWTLVIILGVIIGGLILFSQAKDKSDYNEALRVLGAKQECRAEAKREGWSEAEAGCDKLGTPGYNISTDNYFDAYKLRTGTRGL